MLTNCSKNVRFSTKPKICIPEDPRSNIFTFGSLVVGTYLHKAKKVRWYPLIKEGQRSHKYAFWGVNVAIKMKIALVPRCYILL